MNVFRLDSPPVCEPDVSRFSSGALAAWGFAVSREECEGR